MKVIGCLLVWAVGALFLLAYKKLYSKEPVDYRQYPTVEGTVIGIHEFCGSRWMVRFQDETGRDVIGADDMRAESTFQPQKHSLPRRGDTEHIYYWQESRAGSYRINGTPILYRFHFCNEDFYSLRKERHKRWINGFRIAGVSLFFVGILVLFFGY